ncbi:MAG: hypothetical protein IMZ52_02875 [Actinobacteria bacterium]|nr:hypothetical protein [Actinomycetota bacterium]MBE3114889.1 hypothetical protein [Actinomycetota bacterium]
MAIDVRNTIHKHILNLSYDNVSLSQYEDFRIYKNATILTPGEWTDSITREPVVYTVGELEKSATNWKENYLDLDHSFAVNDRIGYVMNPHADKGNVKADLYIHKRIQSGKDTIERIDCGLVNGVSAELTTTDRYNFSDNKYYAENIVFLGSAIVLFPASNGAKVR